MNSKRVIAFLPFLDKQSHSNRSSSPTPSGYFMMEIEGVKHWSQETLRQPSLPVPSVLKAIDIEKDQRAHYIIESNLRVRVMTSRKLVL